MDNLKQKAVSGVMWTSIQKFAVMGIQFLAGIVLARLLTPEDYGYIGMLSIFMVIADTFVDGGFGSALIQKKRPTQIDYSTVFFFNLGMSLLMYTILFSAAPAIADFYNMPLLSTILRVQGLVLLINAFTLIQRNQLRKQFRFKKLSAVALLTAVISFVVTIFMAYRGYGVWSLVMLNLLSSLIPAIIYWFTNKWYPVLLFSKASFKELFGFGFFMFLSTLITNIGNNIQGLLIGRFYHPSVLGYYTKARNTEAIASTTIANVLGQVVYPLYAEYQYDMPALINAIKRITVSVAYVTFPILALLILLAKPVFVILYSEKWLASVPFFQILCLAGIAICLQGVNFQAVAAVGKSKQVFSWTVVKRTIGILLIVAGLAAYGIKGLLVGMVMQSWVIYLINAYLVHKYIGYKLSVQFLNLLPIMILSIVSWAVTYGLTFLLPHWNMYVIAVIHLLTFVVVYLGCSILFNMESFRYVKETIPMFKVRFKRMAAK